MNKKIMKKWVKALRSGKYRKTTGELCKIAQNGNKSHCCLGVLTELYFKENKDIGVAEVYFNDGALNPVVQDWAGMYTACGILTYNNEETDLTCLNDCKKAKRGFKRIADIIEKNWEQL